MKNSISTKLTTCSASSDGRRGSCVFSLGIASQSLWLFFVMSFVNLATANNGHVAMTWPVSGIEVDGDLGDWPADAPEYPLRRNHFGDSPKSQADMHAWFKVGYDQELDRLYVAVHVDDDSHVLTENSQVERWKAMDGAGVHLAYAHGINGQPVMEAKTIQGQLLAVGKHMRTDLKRTETSHTYEWSFDFQPYREGSSTEHPFTIPFAVYATDKDEDGSISIRFWSPNAWKEYGGANRAGDLIVNVEPKVLGSIRGQVCDDSTQDNSRPTNSYGATLVKYISKTNRHLVVEVMSDTRGHFELQLPPGEYVRSVTDWGNTEASTSIVVVQPGTITDDVIETPKGSNKQLHTESNSSRKKIAPQQTHKLGPGTSASLRLPTITRMQDDLTYGATYTVSRYSASNGLPHGINRDVIVDSLGYTWVGNSFGLLRLSDTEAITYRKRDGLASDILSCLFMHGTQLWIGTNNGVSVVDTTTLHVRQIPEIAGKHIFGIQSLHDGRVGICTGRGLIAVDANKFSVNHYGRPDNLEEVRVLTCCPDPCEEFTWVGTDDGLSLFDGTRFVQNLTAEDGIPDCRIWKIFRDSNDGLWFGANRSLFYYDGQRYHTIHTSENETYQHCDGITQDANGLVWAAVWLDTLQKKQGLVAFAAPTPEGIAHRFPIGAVRTRADRFGNLWVTGSGFVSRLDMRQARIKLGEVSAITLDVAEPESASSRHDLNETTPNAPGNVWFSATDGFSWRLFQTNQHLDSWNEYEVEERASCLLPHSTRDRTIWFGTRDSGLQLFTDGKLYYPDNAKSDVPYAWPRGTAILDLMEIRTDSVNGVSQAGDIWCSTPAGICVIRKERVISFFNPASDDGQAHRFERLDQLSNGAVVCGTYSGVLIVDPETGEAIDKIDRSRGLPEVETPTVAVTPGDNIWIGTSEGLFEYQVASQELAPIEIAGLPVISISRIAVDPSGFVWVVTPQGVTKVDPKRKIFQSNIRPSGATSPPESFQALAFTATDVWAASTEGVVRSHMASSPTQIVIDNVETDRNHKASNTVTCTTDVASVRFHYHADSASSDHAEYLYRYRLVGLDDEWKTTNERTVKIATPPAGAYTFEICTFDQNLIPSDIQQIPLVIKPPYGRRFRTFLAYTSTAASLLFGVFYVANMRRTRVELEERVASRTKEIIAVQEEKQQLREELLHSQKMESLGTMAAGVAHDFNNALSAIVCNAELGLLSTDDPLEVKAALQLVMNASEQASCITQSLLAFAGSAPSKAKPIRFQDLIRSSIELIRSAIPAAIEIDLDLPKTPVWVNADSTQLQQVLVNLCFNARDAMPKGGEITIKLRVEREDSHSLAAASDTANAIANTDVDSSTTAAHARVPKPKFEKAIQREENKSTRDGTEASASSRAVLRVIDNGPGMPPEVMDRVFEPFFTTKARGKGTGLGLSLAHSLIGAHDGTISVTSKLKYGTTFEIVLPTCKESQEPEPHSDVSRTLEILRGAKVLIADDQQRVRDALAKLLRAAAADVTVASSGEDLLRKAETDDYSLVIADIDMPKLSGLDAANKLREADPNLPVLLITGLPTSLPEEIEEEHTSFLRKPFRREAFLSAAARLARH